MCPDCDIRLVAALDRDLSGTVLDNRYEVLGRLGKGGMGVVYRAKQKIIDRIVALKVLRRELVQDEASVKRFLVEAKAVSSLRNAHIVTLYDFGITQEGLLYFTMELLDGRPLTHVIRDEAPLSPRRVASIIDQASQALSEAHHKGILHRDLKPDNIFLIKDPEGAEFAKVLDFGIAKMLDDGSSESITQTGMVCGTPLYLSPEQAMGRSLDARSDIYSLGVIMYEMLSAEPPFVDATPVGILLKQVNEAPRSISLTNPDVAVPAAMDAFLMSVLSKSPDARPQSISEFRDRLAQAMRLGEQCPGDVVPLAALETRANGVRMPAGTIGSGTDPALDETMAVPTPQALFFASETGDMVRTETPMGDTRGRLETQLPGKETSALIAHSTGRRTALWGAGIVALLVIAVGLAFALGIGSGRQTEEEATAKRNSATHAARAAQEEQARLAIKRRAEEDERNAQAALRNQQLEQQKREELLRLESERKKLEQVRQEEQERSKAQEEARLKAEEQAKKKAEEQAKKKAEEEAKKKAEEEAKKKAEEEAKKKARSDSEAQKRRLRERELKEEARKKAEEKKKQENKQDRKKDDELDFENI